MTTMEIAMNAHFNLLNEAIALLKGKKVVFDFDGTMVDFHYATCHLLPCRDDEIFEYSKTGNIYENVRPLASVQYIIENLNPEDVYVLTRTETTLIDKKNDAIRKHYPTINTHHIYHVQDANNKLSYLRKVHTENNNSNVIFVEDTAKTILNAEELYDWVYGIHISSLIG